MKKTEKSFTFKILVTLLLGLILGLATIYLREQLLANNLERVWTSINNLLFADITAANNEKAIGLFYISGQIFLRLLQILLIPLIFTSIIKAIEQIKDTSLLNKLAKKVFKILQLY